MSEFYFEDTFTPLAEKVQERIKGFPNNAPISLDMQIGLMIQQNFKQGGRDQKGNTHTWRKRIKEPKDGHPLMMDTHTLMNDTEIERTNTGWYLHNDVDYAIYHHLGTDNMTMREFLMIPDPDTQYLADESALFLSTDRY